MTRDENPVSPEERLTPRTVPIARSWVAALEQAAYDIVRSFVNEMPRDALLLRQTPLGDRSVDLPTFERANGRRASRLVHLVVTTRAEEGRSLAVGGQLRESSGSLPRITLFLPAGISVAALDYLLDHGLPREMRSVLVHEITHLADDAVRSVHDRGAPPGILEGEDYVNQPEEMRAFTQQIVTDALRWAEIHKRQGRRSLLPAGRYVEQLLTRSPTWETFGPFFSPENHRRLLHTLAAALERRGLLVAFEDTPLVLPGVGQGPLVRGRAR